MHRPDLQIWSLLLGGCLAWWGLASGGPARSGGGEEPPKCAEGVLIRFEAVITTMSEQYLYRKLDVAKKRDADLVIVEIDSPGGELEASLNIAQRLRTLDWAHTVAYVPREAISGGAIVALGCDEIVMGPSARMGDAGPIFLDENFLFQHAPEKIRSDLALQVRDLARAHDRPPALAEAMVNMDLIVYRVENGQTGEITFMSDKEIESADDPKEWKKTQPVFESREDHFLEVNGQRAVELGLAEANAESRRDLEDRYGLTGGLLVLEATTVDTAVTILNWPLVTGLLFVVGLVALLIEFSSPGIGFGGLTAVLCFAIFFWSRFLGGTAGWLEVVLFLVAISFLAAEVFVFPGFGVVGVMGILLLAVSLVLASQTFVVPRTERELAAIGQTLFILLCTGATVGVAAVGLTYYLG
ncbi:MAG: peptidase, partial [Planctomycetes bacterium]|nr:peptidase [Planctomycetota bacterium]